jgi:isoleucyl-tRNA synthetase
MDLVRQIVEVGHRVRKEQKLKVRQPLKEIQINLPKDKQFRCQIILDAYFSLIKEELNVKNLKLSTNVTKEITVSYNTILTGRLKREGQARELIREIQKERRKLELKPDQYINLELSDYPQEFESLIKRKVMAKNIKKGKKLVIRN